jgi:hypothetical protein
MRLISWIRHRGSEQLGPQYFALLDIYRFFILFLRVCLYNGFALRGYFMYEYIYAGFDILTKSSRLGVILFPMHFYQVYTFCIFV